MNQSDPRALHAQALKSRLADRSTYNTLIMLYSKSNLLPYSRRLFRQIPSPNIVSWTALISAHAHTLLSLSLFVSMLRHPILPNQRTLASLLKTCAALPGYLSFGLSLHSLAIKQSLNAQPYSGSALSNFYFKCSLPNDGRKVFEEMTERDAVCYAAIIVGLAQNSKPIDALVMFADMRACYLSSTDYSVSGALRAAADLAAMDQCRILHGHAVVIGMEKNVVVGSALLDGYGKAGLVSDARQVFDENLDAMNIVGWNSLMAAYSQQGDKSSVMELFQLMEAHGFSPDEYTFLALLSAFYNAGSVNELESWLRRMRVEYAVEPQLEHYTCLIGSMARAGNLIEAERLATTMPFKPDAAVWRVLLSGCASHRAADMALKMTRKLLEIDENDDSAYMIAANTLSASGRWGDVAEIRKLMKNRMVKKEGGKSWIEVRGTVHVFLAGDRRHELTREIHAKLTELMEEIEKLGYVPVLDEMLHQVSLGQKKEALRYHSEKLALAFGVMSGAAPPGKPLRIIKNLRICRDCHEAFKYMSRVVEREIIVRDLNRYHRFLNGCCTCQDIW